MGSILQDWAMELPIREQGTMLTCVRGCDLEPKEWTSTGVAESPGRNLTGWIRWCFLHPADPRELEIKGAFLCPISPDPDTFKPSEFGHLPLHWYTHVMHALEVIAYRHPDRENTAHTAFLLYSKMVHTLHLNHEPIMQFTRRLSEDRIATNTVVS